MKISRRKLLLLIGDIFIIGISLHIASLLRFGRWMSVYEGKNLLGLIFILFSVLISFYIFDFYSMTNFFSSRSMAMFLGAMATVALLMVVCFYFIPFGVGRGIFFYTFLSVGLLSLAWRAIFSSVFKIVLPVSNVLVIGEGEKIKDLSQIIKNFPEYKVVSFFTDLDSNLDSNEEFATRPNFLGNVNKIEQIVAEHGINSIVVDLQNQPEPNLSRALVNCRLKGVGVYDIPSFYEQLTGKLPVHSLKDHWFLSAQGFERQGSGFFKKLKRCFDFMVALLFMILSLPLALIVVLIIKFTSKGPVFYLQERLGESEKPFTMYKFRTMVEGAEKDEPKWAEEQDERVTTVGKVLRKTRLDELPQLINVLKGDMSFIGPRPEREYFIKLLKKKIPYYSLRFAVKPGITGWAQVNYRYGATVEDALEKLGYDLYYIKNMSLFLDLRILLRTVRVCLFGMGSR